jgi:protein phosphatase
LRRLSAGLSRPVRDSAVWCPWVSFESEAKTHPRRNVLQKALGAGHRYVDPQIGAIGLDPGSRFLLCTDGVTDGLYDARLDEALREESPEQASAIVRSAVEASGRDNATALVVTVR